MTEPRDIEKDKATLDWFDSEIQIPTMAIAKYYIDLCEAQQVCIAELERQLQLHNRSDVTNMQEHDETLERFFKNLYGGTE